MRADIMRMTRRQLQLFFTQCLKRDVEQHRQRREDLECFAAMLLTGKSPEK